jgi:hypothetical protein
MRGESLASSVWLIMRRKEPKIEAYAIEKSYTTLDILATGQGALKDRIVDAWASHFIRIAGVQLPAEFADRYEALDKKITSHPAERPGEGTIEASVRHMSDLEAKRFAEELFSFILDVLREGWTLE